MTELSDETIGSYWDQHLAPSVAGIPDSGAVEQMRARYIGDVRASPAAMRQIVEAPADWPDDQVDCGCCEIGDFAPTGDPDLEPWCANCDHSPEEHES